MQGYGNSSQKENRKRQVELRRARRLHIPIARRTLLNASKLDLDTQADITQDIKDERRKGLLKTTAVALAVSAGLIAGLIALFQWAFN